MSNLSFIPAASTSKPTQDLQHPSLSEKRTEFAASSFDQFLKSANESQSNTKPLREKSRSNLPLEKEVKSGPKQDEFKTTEQFAPDQVKSQPKPNQEAANQEKPKKASRPQGQNAEKEKVASEINVQEDQKSETTANVAQAGLTAMLAHLVEAEAEIRGETQPETVQMAEVAEVMGDTEPETVVLVEANEINPGLVMSGTGVETPMLNAAELKQDAELKAADLETPAKTGTADSEQLSQVLPQVSGEHSQTKEFLSNQGRDDGKGQISESIKVFYNENVEIGSESQTFSQVFAENTLSQKAEIDLRPEGNRVLAEKGGKVNLAVIQTQLAVDRGSDVKTEMSVLNILPSHSSVNNTIQAQTSETAETAPVNREELFSQLVEHAKVVVDNGGSEMEVSLKPEHLGKLQLKVTIDNEVVTAKFVAESQQVKEIIESNLSQLKRNLQENGMQVDTIMVSVGNHQSNEGFEQAASNREQFHNSGGSIAGINDDAVLETQEPMSSAQSDTLIDLIA